MKKGNCSGPQGYPAQLVIWSLGEGREGQKEEEDRRRGEGGGGCRGVRVGDQEACTPYHPIHSSPGRHDNPRKIAMIPMVTPGR